MPPKTKKRGKKGKKAKKVKYVPDPDLAYKQELHREYYLPKIFWERHEEDLLVLIDEAITAALVGDLNSTQKPQPNEVPMAHLSSISGSLGLCLSADQLRQMKAMVTPVPKVTSDLQDLEAFDRALTSEPVVEMADKEKLRRLLLELLHTRVLSYDAQVLHKPDPKFPVRVLSVVYSTEDRGIQKCFDALWPACGSQYTITPQNDKIRCLGVSELREMITRPDSVEPPFTDDELQAMILAFEDTGEDMIREDNFLLVMQDVL